MSAAKEDSLIPVLIELGWLSLATVKSTAAFILYALGSLGSILLPPLRSSRHLALIPYRGLLYILAPALILFTICFDLFVLLPYSFFSNAIDALYPVYVLAGAAAIVATVIGYSAKRITKELQTILEPTKSKSKEPKAELTYPDRPPRYDEAT